jgi:hypothetical protein
MKTGFVTRGLSLLLLLASGTTWAGSGHRYAVIGDAGDWNELSSAVERSILDHGVSDLILPGDNVYPGLTYEDAWGPWIRDGFRFPVVAIGNHTEGYDAEIDFFRMPDEAYTKRLAPGVLAIVLNSDNVETAEEQAAFLERVLDRANEDSIFVVYHHPSLSLTAHHPWTEREEFQARIRPILQRHRSRISAVLNGHDHVAGAFSFDSLPVFVSGAVKEVVPFTAFTNRQEGIRVKTEWVYSPRPTWLQLTVHADSAESTLTFIDARSNRATCTVRVRTGEWLWLEDDCYEPDLRQRRR